MTIEPRSIAVATAENDLGWVLMAASPRGVRHLRFGDCADALVAGLRAECPYDVLVHERDVLDGWMADLEAALQPGAVACRLPLDVSGTAFQLRVWQALRAIPSGETRTYGELAASLGLPRGARAVARACATNPVAVAIPCHRVVPRGRDVGGYRYGVERKRRLLEREARRDG